MTSIGMENTVCETGSYCDLSMNSQYMNRFKQEPCATKTAETDNERNVTHAMYIPDYKKQTCRNNAFATCDSTSRFNSKKVLQESFLRGLGQVSGATECFGSKLIYTPEQIWTKETEEDKSKLDMQLFAQPTHSKKSCGSLTELDLMDRLKPLPGRYQDAFLPAGMPAPSSTSRLSNLVPNVLQEDMVTLSTKKYPEFPDIKQQSLDAMKDEKSDNWVNTF